MNITRINPPKLKDNFDWVLKYLFVFISLFKKPKKPLIIV